MAALSAFAKYVRTEVSGCPEIQILDAILRAGIQFCKKSKAIKEKVSITTVAGVSEYAITLPTGLIPEEILTVKRGQYDDLEASSFQSFENKNLHSIEGAPSYFYMNGSNKLVLGAIPVGIELLTVQLRVRPIEDATVLPDELFNRYRDEIAAGAKSRLMLMKEQPWTDIPQAGIYRTLFTDAIDESNMRDAKGAAGKRLRTVGHQF